MARSKSRGSSKKSTEGRAPARTKARTGQRRAVRRTANVKQRTPSPSPVKVLPPTGAALVAISRDARRRATPGASSGQGVPRETHARRSRRRVLTSALRSARIDNKAKVCSERRTRREVIHATGVAGSSVRPPRYTSKSRVRCK